MEASVLAVMARTAECAALLFIGYNLRSAQLFSATDAEAAQRLAGYLTLPALLLHSCNMLPPLSWQALIGGPVVAAASAVAAAFAWFRFQNRNKRDRAVLCGAATGSDAAAVGIPLIEALAGPVGVVAAASALIVNTLAVSVGSYLLTASAGPAFPESYKHDDGGSYRGEWRGLNKEGLGVYTYPSGAKYEGEWRNNLKDGRGVYYFPKGGTYEGEWAAGVMSGTGLRTYSSGKVTAGRFENGKLFAPLELWQCATAAEGAAEAALAARRVVVGGGKPIDAIQQLITQPLLWAALIGLGLNALAVPLPGSVAAVAAALAPANKALMLLSAGMLLQPQLPQMRQVSDVATVIATRAASALVFTSLALVLLPGSAHPVGRVSVLAAAAVLLSPIPLSALDFTRIFRLNESLSSACRDASIIMAGPLLLLLAFGVGALNLLPTQLPGPAQAMEVSILEAGSIDASGAATMLAAVMLVLAAAVIIAVSVIADKFAVHKKVTMRYAGHAAAAGGGSSGGGSDATGGAGSAGAAAPPRAFSSCSTMHASGCSSTGGRPRQHPQQQQQCRHLWAGHGMCRQHLVSLNVLGSSSSSSVTSIHRSGSSKCFAVTPSAAGHVICMNNLWGNPTALVQRQRQQQQQGTQRHIAHHQLKHQIQQQQQQQHGLGCLRRSGIVVHMRQHMYPRPLPSHPRTASMAATAARQCLRIGR